MYHFSKAVLTLKAVDSSYSYLKYLLLLFTDQESENQRGQAPCSRSSILEVEEGVFILRFCSHAHTMNVSPFLLISPLLPFPSH